MACKQTHINRLKDAISRFDSCKSFIMDTTSSELGLKIYHKGDDKGSYLIINTTDSGKRWNLIVHCTTSVEPFIGLTDRDICIAMIVNWQTKVLKKLADREVSVEPKTTNYKEKFADYEKKLESYEYEVAVLRELTKLMDERSELLKKIEEMEARGGVKN